MNNKNPTKTRLFYFTFRNRSPVKEDVSYRNNECEFPPLTKGRARVGLMGRAIKIGSSALTPPSVPLLSKEREAC